MFKKLLFKKTNNSLIQFLRSVIVGVVATVIDIGVLTILVEAFNVNVFIATAIGFIVGLLVNFFISSVWVFEKSKVVKNRVSEFIIFALIGVVGLIINELIVNFFDLYLAKSLIFGSFIDSDKYYLIGKLVATVIAFVWNFFARKFIIYRNEEK